MTTVGEALDAFDAAWVAEQSITPQTAYRRTLRLLRFYLTDHAPDVTEPVTALQPSTWHGFVLWHRQHALTDSAEGTRKAAVHLARLGAFMRDTYGLEELAVDRDTLRRLVPDQVPS